jgi:hypothetical protein
VSGYRALRGADVGDHGLRTGRLQSLVDERGKSPDRRAGEDGIGPSHRVGHGDGRAVDRATFGGGSEHVGIRIEAGDLGAAAPGGQADGPADQPDAENR